MNAAKLARAIDAKAYGHGAAWSCRCPAHEDRRPSLSVRDGERGILLTCYAGCDRRDVIAELRHRGLWPGCSNRPHAAPPRRARTRPDPRRYQTFAPWARALWDACRPIEPRTVAATYLERRGSILPPVEGDLRWHPELHDRLSGYRGPALVGLVTDVVTSEAINLHRTWLAANGISKAPIPTVRRLLKGHGSRGVIRLYPDEEVTIGLVIGEGIETCLAAAGAGLVPVWSTLCANNLATLPVLPGIEGLTVLVDHDRPDRRGRRAGIYAALELVRRYADAGFDLTRDLIITLPDREGLDVADLVNGSGDA